MEDTMINLDAITLDDCILLNKYKDVEIELNDGKVVGFGGDENVE